MSTPQRAQAQPQPNPASAPLTFIPSESMGQSGWTESCASPTREGLRLGSLRGLASAIGSIYLEEASDFCFGREKMKRIRGTSGPLFAKVWHSQMKEIH